jgi:hypothetical protein
MSTGSMPAGATGKLASFRKIDFFTAVGPPALEHCERDVKGAVGRDLIALDCRELGPLHLEVCP